MNALVDRPKSAEFQNGYVSVALESGRTLKFPIAGNPKLEKGTRDQLGNIELSPYGLHWPDLDEDLSISGIAAGDYGQQKAHRAQRPAPTFR
jgi:hypothetical protein